jgi:RNA polymerase sigma-70 factor (ECF subfamily)
MPSIETVPKDESLGHEHFDKLFHDYRAMIYRVAYSILKRREDAQDVLQSIFTVLLDGQIRTELVDSPKAYLHRMAVNCSLNMLRSRGRQKVDSDTDVEYLESPAPSTTGNDGFSPEFQEILSQLKPIVAEMVILRYAEDYSDERIAMLLGRPRIWVAVTLSRARKKLGKAMRPSGEAR